MRVGQLKQQVVLTELRRIIMGVSYRWSDMKTPSSVAGFGLSAVVAFIRALCVNVQGLAKRAKPHENSYCGRIGTRWRGR